MAAGQSLVSTLSGDALLDLQLEQFTHGVRVYSTTAGVAQNFEVRYQMSYTGVGVGAVVLAEYNAPGTYYPRPQGAQGINVLNAGAANAVVVGGRPLRTRRSGVTT